MFVTVYSPSHYFSAACQLLGEFAGERRDLVDGYNWLTKEELQEMIRPFAETASESSNTPPQQSAA